MKTLLQTPIGEIEDESIKHLVQDLCEMLILSERDYLEYNFFEFLGVVIRESGKKKGRPFSLDYSGAPHVLTRKLETLRDDGIFQVCRELKNDDTSKLRGELTLFQFLKKHVTDQQTPVKPRRPQTNQERDLNIAKQRRKNRE